MKFFTPLRYYDGRDGMTGFMKMILEQNDLLGSEYVEPHAGSAAIALDLLTHGYVSKIHLNEPNPQTYAFWHSVINEPEALCKTIRDAKITFEEWQRQQAILNSPGNHSALELGFSIFFLNRVNRSGILWESANNNRNGQWKFDARFDKNDLIRRIEWIALHRSLIRLYHLDVPCFIQTTLPSLPARTLVYLNTPCDASEFRFRYDQHQPPSSIIAHDIAHLIKTKIEQFWIASYAYAAETSTLYQGYSSMTYQTVYDHFEQTRIMFFSRKLIIPNMQTLSKLKTA